MFACIWLDDASQQSFTLFTKQRQHFLEKWTAHLLVNQTQYAKWKQEMPYIDIVKKQPVPSYFICLFFWNYFQGQFGIQEWSICGTCKKGLKR